MRLGDRIAVMAQGRIVQLGTAQDLYTQPQELFVARLFSEINEIRTRVSGGCIDTPIGAIPAPGIANGEPAVLCLRERSIKVWPAGNPSTITSPSNAITLPGRVLHVRFLGDVVLVEVAVQGFDDPLKVRSPQSDGLGRGANVTVEIDPTRALVFAG